MTAERFGELDYGAYQVMYVGHDRLVRETVTHQFRREFTGITAETGEEGLMRCAERDIAVVLADQALTTGAGEPFFETVKTRWPHTVLIMLSTATDSGGRVDVDDSDGVTRYLRPPYDTREIRAAFKDGIERYVLIKERNLLHAERNEALRRAERANRLSAVGILAAGFAHEINNPLVPISTFLQLLPAKRAMGDEDPEYWDSLYRVTMNEVERIRKLVADLLGYAKASSAPGPQFARTDINEALREVAALLTLQGREIGVTIQINGDGSLPTIVADRERIKQVFLNLMLNGLQAMPAGGVLTVSTRTTVRDSPHVEVTVTDTGVGISPESLAQLSLPFFTTKGSEGSGLGLMICRHIVDAHGGEISVESTPGLKTAFAVKLPLNPRRSGMESDEARRTPAA